MHGMMQDPAQMAQERLERVEVLAGCGGEALRERYYGSRNEGAAACAAASERPGRERLPVMAAIGTRREIRQAERHAERAESSEESEESSEDSEDADQDGGAAACAAACRIEQIGGELQELQERIADLVVERRELQRSVRSDGAEEQGAEDMGNGEQSDDSDAEGSVSAVRWVEDSDGELEDCSDRMVTVTNVPDRCQWMR